MICENGYWQTMQMSCPGSLAKRELSSRNECSKAESGGAVNELYPRRNDRRLLKTITFGYLRFHLSKLRPFSRLGNLADFAGALPIFKCRGRLGSFLD